MLGGIRIWTSKYQAGSESGAADTRRDQNLEPRNRLAGETGISVVVKLALIGDPPADTGRDQGLDQQMPGGIRTWTSRYQAGSEFRIQKSSSFYVACTQEKLGSRQSLHSHLFNIQNQRIPSPTHPQRIPTQPQRIPELPQRIPTQPSPEPPTKWRFDIRI